MDRVLAYHTDSIVMFDVPPPLQAKGIAAYKKQWKLRTNIIPLRMRANSDRQREMSTITQKGKLDDESPLILYYCIDLGLDLMAGTPFRFEATPTYIASLVYLALFGSIIALGAYLTLLGRIGADRASYSSLLFPLVALGISTLFEGYQWSAPALVGVLLVLTGNFLVLSRWRKMTVASRAETRA